MPNTHSEKKARKDERTKAIESNPCGICRANGSPTCKGHGGGGSTVKSDGFADSLAQTSTVSSQLRLTLLQTQFSLSTLWEKVEGLKLTYIFKNPAALFTMKLDIDRNQLHFFSDENLSKDQQEDRRLFLETLFDELNLFKAELTRRGISVEYIKAIQNGNTISLTFGDTKQYDVFVQRLIDKNILPMRLTPAPQRKDEKNRGEEQGHRYSAPTPFDLSGPRLK